MASRKRIDPRASQTSMGWKNRVEPTIQEQEQFYDKWWQATSRQWFTHQHLKNRVFAIRTILKRLAVKNARILEIGCGIGSISGELVPFGRVEAVELSPEAIRIARQRHPKVNFFQGDVFAHDFGDSKYEILVTSEVLEHIPLDKRRQFLDILHHLLQPRGWLILITPNGAVSSRIGKEQIIENHFAEDELREFLEARFRIELFSTVQNFLPVVANRSRIFQAIRIIIYEVLRLRSLIEDPYRKKRTGLYFVVVARPKV